MKRDYQTILLPENFKVPLWLNVEIKDSIIYIVGTPREVDEGEYILQIVSKS